MLSIHLQTTIVADRPFKEGDWCEVDGSWVVVQHIGWRTTRFQDTWTGGTRIIPNGMLSKQVIVNVHQEGALCKEFFKVGFSYNDPPNLVKQVLRDVAWSIDGMWNVVVMTLPYTEDGIYYRVLCFFDQWDWVDIYDTFNTRLYYAAKRHGLTFARPIEYRGNLHDLKPAVATQRITTTLQTNPLFQSLEDESLQKLVAGTTVHHYTEGEIIIRQGDADEGLYVIQAGEVTLAVKDESGATQDMAHLKAAEFFGELALLKNEPSPISARALTDVDLLIIDGGIMTQLIETQPQFAQELNLFIEKRQTQVLAMSEMGHGKPHQTARQDWMDVARRV